MKLKGLSVNDSDTPHLSGNRYSLAAYDAAYLELAIRQGLLLATLDTKLEAAAKACDALLEVPAD